MAILDEVRALGGWAGLSDDRLNTLIALAEEDVRADLQRLGLSPDLSARDHLVALRACALAARIARPPVSEGIGGVSATYTELDWSAEYAKALNAVRMTNGKAVEGGVL